MSGEIVETRCKDCWFVAALTPEEKRINNLAKSRVTAGVAGPEDLEIPCGSCTHDRLTDRELSDRITHMLAERIG